MPTIKVISPTRVDVDGQDAGNLVDYILANPTQRALIANELSLWHNGHVSAGQAKDAEVAAAKSAASAKVAAAELAASTATAAADAKVSAIESAAGGTVAVAAILAARAAAEKSEKRAALARQLADMDKPDTKNASAPKP